MFCGCRRLQEQEAKCCSSCKVAIYCGAECQRAHWKVHKPECGVAVAQSPSKPIAASECAEDAPGITIEEAPSVLERCLKAVQCAPDDGKVWRDLGKALNSDDDSVTVDGRDFTKQQCFVESLRCDPTFSASWFQLGLTTAKNQRITVHGKGFTKQQCFIEALRLNRKCTKSWCHLGESMSRHAAVTVNAPLIVSGNVTWRPYGAIRIVAWRGAGWELRW